MCPRRCRGRRRRARCGIRRSLASACRCACARRPAARASGESPQARSLPLELGPVLAQSRASRQDFGPLRDRRAQPRQAAIRDGETRPVPDRKRRSVSQNSTRGRTQKDDRRAIHARRSRRVTAIRASRVLSSSISLAKISMRSARARRKSSRDFSAIRTGPRRVRFLRHGKLSGADQDPSAIPTRRRFRRPAGFART